MLRITQIKIAADDRHTKLEDKICAVLKIKKERLLSWKILRRSIEARRREALSYVYTVGAEIKGETAYLRRTSNKNISEYKPEKYVFKASGTKEMHDRPVIIGSGPAGLFCAFFLAEHGYRPIVLERGECIDKRTETIDGFWKTGRLNTESNVQFGEGGAGTFSDGKLNTGISDSGRIRAVLETFVKFGAQSDILIDAKPHMGTDVLKKVIANMRRHIISCGGEFRFNTRADEVIISDGHVKGVRSGDDFFETNACVAAIGHSARDTMHMLYKKGILMEPKAFAVGVRIQHTQEFINKSQWGDNAPPELGAAAYSLSAKTRSGRGVYTFCMCPGGYVVNASSEGNMLAVNGMSYSGRASGFANSAIISTVSPEDYFKYSKELPKALSAIEFQRYLEKNAFNAAQGKIPVQRFEDFARGNNNSSVSSSFAPCTKGDWEYADVRNIFPEFIAESLCEGITKMGERLKGFDENALLMGVESRTSSPVRMIRDNKLQSSIKGFYPCGEGAGYAGGITSAAVDGIKVAEAIAMEYRGAAC